MDDLVLEGVVERQDLGLLEFANFIFRECRQQFIPLWAVVMSIPVYFWVPPVAEPKRSTTRPMISASLFLAL